MSRFAPGETVSPEQHREWCLKIWRRMDRDHSESITAEELDSDEFRSILRVMMVPVRGPGYMGGAVYERSHMNMDQALHFIMAKADTNEDQCISFEEFESFMKYMRQDHTSKHTADLVFALFDLDSDNQVSEAEFREIWRFYAGHNPTEADFQAEWSMLDSRMEGSATRQQYIRWLQTSNNPVFHQHAPAHRQEEALAASGSASPSSTRPSRQERLQSLEGRHSQTRRRRNLPTVQPLWLQRFNTGANPNDHCPAGRRNYFMRPQSLPELTRHYQTHRGFKEQARKLAQPKVLWKAPVLTPETPDLDPMRGKPGWAVDSQWHMPNRTTGSKEWWKDHWQTPKCAQKRHRPGAWDIRPLGEPAPWMFSLSHDED